MDNAAQFGRQICDLGGERDLKVNARFGGHLLNDLDRGDIAAMAGDHAGQFVQNSQAGIGVDQEAYIVVSHGVYVILSPSALTLLGGQSRLKPPPKGTPGQNCPPSKKLEEALLAL